MSDESLLAPSGIANAMHHTFDRVGQCTINFSGRRQYTTLLLALGDLNLYRAFQEISRKPRKPRVPTLRRSGPAAAV